MRTILLVSLLLVADTLVKSKTIMTYTRQLLLTYNKQPEAFVMNWIIQNANLETQP